MKPIRQIEPWIDRAELKELKRAIRSKFVTESDLTKEFEHRLSELTAAKYVLSTSNGSGALFCALRALGVGPGDEVIVPDLTFVATANAVILAGAKPVLCDIDSSTFCMDPKSAQQKINRRTKAILPVHLYGQSADMDELSRLASKNALSVLEDAAQGVGVRFRGRHVGTFGDAGVLSFYGNKTITSGQGGAILTNNKKLYQKCYRLKNHGRLKKGTFVHEEIGFNFSFTELQAAVGIAQLKKLNRVIQKKRQIHEFYREAFSQLAPDVSPTQIDSRCEPVYWFSSFLFKKAEQLSRHLELRGIQTRRFFYPLHKQPCYPGNDHIKKTGTFENTEKAYRLGLSLPSSFELTREDQKHVIHAIFNFYRGRE